MICRGRIQKGGLVVLNNPDALAEGTEVEVVAGETMQQPTWAEVLKDFIGTAKGLPADSSKNHDHYLYGAKRK